MLLVNKETRQKWDGVVSDERFPEIQTEQHKLITSQLLENASKEMSSDGYVNLTDKETLQKLYEATEGDEVIEGALNESNGPTNVTGSAVAYQDPVLISMIRRAAPQLMHDLVGIQPMNGPTGLVFAMRAHYGGQTGEEALHNEADTSKSTVVSGANTLGQKDVVNSPGSDMATISDYNFAEAMSTAQGEVLGGTGNSAWQEMSFSIDKLNVTAKTRAIKAEYSHELAQDLKATHNMSASQELSRMLSQEITNEINRELVRTVNISAITGAQQTEITTQGVFDLDVDSDGRWLGEKFKGLMFQIEREANRIAIETRRGKGNLVVCSSDVASALAMAGILDYTPAINSTIKVDDTGNTFAGVLNGFYKVFIDPYAPFNYITVGYKGANAMDAGIFYSPYVPMWAVKGIGEDTFQPKIGFKTRYAVSANPFAQTKAGNEALVNDIASQSNVYYRNFKVVNLM